MSWVDEELAGCEFQDKRLGTRLRSIMERLSDGLGDSIPTACQDWANTKAAYRFFSNDRVTEADILAGHFQATRGRFEATSGPILVLQDTTELSYQREKPYAVGVTRKSLVSNGEYRRAQVFTVCGVLLHSSLAVTPEGLPLGLGAVTVWTRKKFKNTKALHRRVNATRIPIEEKESYRWIDNLRQSTALLGDPSRCIHVGDRESDIYELYCEAKELGTHFLVRLCNDRLAGEDDGTISEEMRDVRQKGLHRVEVRDDKSHVSTAVLEIRFARMRVHPPIGKQNRYPDLTLTVIYAQERGRPKGRKKIDWKLITDLSVASRADAVEKINWYATRWKIETFHKILKSGCRAEDSKLRTAERLANLIAVFCILSWRVFWMTMMNRSEPNAPASICIHST